MFTGVSNSIIKFFIPLASFLTVFSACTTTPPPDYESEWKYTDLRLLDPADSQDTSSDLVALYTRDSAFDLQIRIDLLELDPLSNFDIYLAIDNQTGGHQFYRSILRLNLNGINCFIYPTVGT